MTDASAPAPFGLAEGMPSEETEMMAGLADTLRSVPVSQVDGGASSSAVRQDHPDWVSHTVDLVDAVTAVMLIPDNA